MKAARRWLQVAPVVALAATCGAHATVMGEVGSVLVFPLVLNQATSPTQPRIETFLTITNMSASPVRARLRFVHGTTCATCSTPAVELGALDSDTIVVSRNVQTGQSVFRNADDGGIGGCPGGDGFAIVTIEDPATGTAVASDVLAGDSVVVDYQLGTTTSTAPVTLRGFAATCRTCLDFDGAHFELLPAVTGASFLAPASTRQLDALLGLFTLGFQSGVPPSTSCSVTGSTPSGQQFTKSFQFGCWTHRSLVDIDPAFVFPLAGGAEHGWLMLSCSVNGDAGGVHGVLTQSAASGVRLRRGTSGPTLGAPTAWARELFESSTVGQPFTFCPSVLPSEDPDSDSVPSVCDNCPAVANPGQQNADGDAEGDACDCAPADPTNPVPGASITLRVGDLARSTVLWSEDPNATSYDLLRGRIASLPVGPGGDDEFCFNDLPGTATSDSSNPASPAGFWYLVRGSSACGAGSYGFQGVHGAPGAPRVSTTCP